MYDHVYQSLISVRQVESRGIDIEEWTTFDLFDLFAMSKFDLCFSLDGILFIRGYLYQ